jgi:hypothetical protein
VRHREHGLPVAVVPALIAVAIVAFLAGHSGAKSSAPESLRSASNANVALDYPSEWRLVRDAAGIPGLPIGHPILLAPHGDAARAGLVVGSLPSGESSPLPEGFVASLPRPPETQIVNLLEVQASRYAQLSAPGFAHALTVFVIPDLGASPTALACYASTAGSADMRACEQTVATATLAGQSQTYELAPDTVYARRVSAVIVSLDALRAALKRELRPQATAESVQSLAGRLAGGFADSAASLAALEPPLGAGRAQAALSASLLRAHEAYDALASAAGEESAAGYVIARNRVSVAEANVNSVLEGFALLGYGPSEKTSQDSPT